MTAQQLVTNFPNADFLVLNINRELCSVPRNSYKLYITSTILAAEEYDRAAAIAARKEAAKTGRRKKKKTASSTSLASNTFQELYRLTGEVLGQGAYAIVQTCVNIYTEVEYAVKIIDKVPGHSRARVFKEIDLFHHVQVGIG